MLHEFCVLVLKRFVLKGPAPVAPLKSASRGKNTFILFFLYRSHRSVILPRRDDSDVTLFKDTRGAAQRRVGTRGFSHFSKSTRNRERQAMSDGISSERENSGGQ